MKIFKFMMIPLVAMCALNSCSEDCDHDYIEYDYTKDLVGTWSVVGADYVEALVIKDDGTMHFTIVDGTDLSEFVARYEVENKRMKVIWDDGAIEEGRLDVVRGASFSVIFDDETGAGYYYARCPENLSDKMVGSWLFQTDETSEIHSYYEDGTTDCRAYYYHLDEQLETLVTGTYKVIGNILFETVTYAEDIVLSFGSRISHVPGGSPFGDVLNFETFTMEGNELKESVTSLARVKPSLDLAGMKYDYKETLVPHVKGQDKEMNFMGFTLNFAKMDGSELDKLLRTLLFHIEFPDANTLHYTYQQNFDQDTFDAPVEVEDNKITVKMSAKAPTLKDVTFYAFQNVDGNRMHLCMDKVAFVNFHTNMQAMLLAGSNEQFDITDAEAVNDIYNNINNAVESIKVSFVMTKSK